MAFIWQQNISSGASINVGDVTELRGNVDIVDGKKCGSNNAAYWSANNGTVDSGDNTTVRTSNYSGDNATYNSGVNGVDNTTVRSSNYTTDNSTYDSTAKLPNNASVNSANKSGDYSNQCTSHYSLDDTTYRQFHYSSYTP